MNKKNVKLLNLTNDAEILAILQYTTTSPTQIIVSYENKSVSAENTDLVDTLIEIRKQLNEENLDILVNGSRRDISASPRIKKAFAGEKIYRIRQLDVGAGYEDIIHIFDQIKKDDLYSISEQKKYHKLWLESLKPSDGEKKEAKNHPNGWVYRFDRPFSEEETVPPEAIIGAWEVDSNGNLTGIWKNNKNYIPREIREKDRKN